MNLEQMELEGMDTPVGDDQFDDGKVAKEFQTDEEQTYWREELEAEGKEHERFRKRGSEIIKRYVDERGENDRGQSWYNLLASNTEIKHSALYARTPVPEISRRFSDANDDVSRVASSILQRCISIELEQENFDTKFKQISLDRLLPGLGVAWARLESDENEQMAYIDYVCYDDFFWAPSKVWTNCRWVARRVPMSKEAIKDRFSDTAPKGTIQNLSFSQNGSRKFDPSAASTPTNLTVDTLDVYEIWDKTRGLVFWITDSADVPLDVSEDTTHFPDFFPTSLPPLGRFTTTNTIPIPDFQLCQDQYVELDDLNNRCSKLVQALKLRWVYDNSRKELKDLYTTTGELQGIGVDDWATFAAEKGGLKSSIEFAPLDEIAGTYQKLIVARETVKQQIYDIEGISDLMRGNSQPYESATQTSAKSAASSTRLGVAQFAAADYIARLLRLKAHLITKFYSLETILKRVGELPEADRKYVPAAIELLKNSEMSQFRLLVSVDSIQMPNFVAEKAERNEFIQAVTGLIAQMMPAIAQTPELGPLAIELVKFGVAGYRGANAIEGVLDSALDQMAQQKQQNDANKPPSEAEMKKAMHDDIQRTKLMVTEMNNRTEKDLAGMSAHVKGLEMQIKAKDLELKEKQQEFDMIKQMDERDNNIIDRAHKIALDLNPTNQITGGE
jgi:hypothetical protein